MRINKKFREDCELVFTYLDFRNSFNMGYVSYNIYKNRIWYITGNRDFKYVRRIFDWLLTNKFMKKKRRIDRVVYLFNPYGIDEEILIPNGRLVFL